MNIAPAKNPHAFKTPPPSGFALIVTVSLMVLLMVLAVGLLSLSSIAIRTSSHESAALQARANARLALMVALGELQKEMGPDMRISGESALFDSNKDTETIDGVAQSHWLASYQSWGDWLNAGMPSKTASNPGYTFTKLDGSTTTVSIADTYTPRRSKMFRRWLLSLPSGQETNINAPDSIASWNDNNSVVLVGENSLGSNATSDQITRAYLTPVGTTGKCAWWIGPENHKARIDKAKNPRTLDTDAWQASQGDTAEVGVGSLTGFQSIDQDATAAKRLITTGTLNAAGIPTEITQQHFFDLTAQSQGVLASVRTGHLKKDLSLLFESKDGTQLPEGYKFDPNPNKIPQDIREPSIRPMSPEIAGRPVLKNRHFASWTNMRHYYRMYRQGTDSDATTVKALADGATGAANEGGALVWEGTNPVSDSVYTYNVATGNSYSNRWQGNNQYWRFPILTQATYIYSLMTEDLTGGNYSCYITYTPVYTFWNPYNVRLRIPNNQLVVSTSPWSCLPASMNMEYQGSPKAFTVQDGLNKMRSPLTDKDPYIVFEPGEFRIFSHSGSPTVGLQTGLFPLHPGFTPTIAGGKVQVDFGSRNAKNKWIAKLIVKSTDQPKASIRFDYGDEDENVISGNTPGALNINCEWNYQGYETLFPSRPPRTPLQYQIDWFQTNQRTTPITKELISWDFISRDPKPFAYTQLTLKCATDSPYLDTDWEDWKLPSRSWIYGAPFYFGHGMYASQDEKTIHTQRLENPYIMRFGPTTQSELPKIVQQNGTNGYLGSGDDPYGKVSQVAAIELPSAPISSLAGFSGMRINPGWTMMQTINPNWSYKIGWWGNAAMNSGDVKAISYQSGVTGPGIGNSFMHPILPRNDVYAFFDNSVSMTQNAKASQPPLSFTSLKTDAYCDYWDHVFLLNDALWDDYFVSSLANQTRPGASAAVSLSANLDRLVAGTPISNSRYHYYSGGRTAADIKAELTATDGYLKAAKNLVVDGMFNVNSTSVSAWQALFAGIRERQLVYRDKNGNLQKITVPNDKRIAISRFDTEISDKEMDDPADGVKMPGGLQGWSGVRFLSDDQLKKLAEECVKQVKKRGPFLNFAEFINRRLSNDELGTMGALQSAIDYDDSNPESGSINYNFKNTELMINKGDLGTHSFNTPEAAEGSRLAGIPGYVIQSDLLKPIANTLAVRDDTFRIRAYGETLDTKGNVIARAWCEAIVQRAPEYVDPTNDASVPARSLDLTGGTVAPIGNTKFGTFSDNAALSTLNRTFGRKFQIESFRWLNKNEI